MPQFIWYIAQVIKQHETKNNKQNMNTYFVYALHKHFKVLNVLVKIIRAGDIQYFITTDYLKKL